jgi:hypothetical protein
MVNKALDEAVPARKTDAAMHNTPRPLVAAALAVSFVLAACNSEPETIVADRYDPQAEALKNAPQVELPPAIQASRTYRCRDNSLVYADFYTNDTVQVRPGQRSADPVTLRAEDGTPPYTAEGWSISANAEQVTITQPGRGSQSCRTN